jgi:E3 ubiquitin-protein ligase BRE1
MESRKRPHLDDGEPLQAKKRALASPNGTPYINGVVAETEEPTDNDSLEVSILPTSFYATYNVQFCA